MSRLTTAVRRRSFAVIAATAGIVALTLSAGPRRVSEARAETRNESPQLATAREHCVLRGYPRVAAHVPIWSARTGGTAIAAFSGNQTPLALDDVDPQGRSGVNTGTGTGSFRIEGFADTQRLPVFARARIPVVPRHVWIGEHQPVRLVEYDRDEHRMKIAFRSREPIDETFEAWTTCKMLVLEVPPAPEPPRLPVQTNSLGYLAEGETITVYDVSDAPRRKVVAELRHSGHGVFFWGEDERDGLVRVRHTSDVAVYGWVERSALRQLPPGEIADQPGLLRTLGRMPRYLRPSGELREVVTRGEVPIRLGPRSDAKVVGLIEKKTRTIVRQVAGGWARVLPANMHIVPGPKTQFWVRADALR